jgi:NAD(P)-dependent dehydrogenase (short-subunit alcohol dehydrogenase family)
MSEGLAGKVAVVTGGASGLGREVVDVMTGQGAAVVIFDRDGAGAIALADTLAAKGRKVAAFAGDVTRDADFAAAIALARARFGGFDIIHNNAGVIVDKPLHDTTDSEYDFVMDVNVRGVFLGCRAALHAFREQGVAGVIINTASIAAHAGDSASAIYTTSKTALLGLTRSIASGYAAEGIRANCVSPGDMKTPMLQQYWAATGDAAAAEAAMVSQYPCKRVADPREVAQVVAFLASDEASFVNGQSIVADGGLLSALFR